MLFPKTHLTLSLTHACNLRCQYCYGGEKIAHHMPRERGEKAIRLACMRTSGRLSLIFFGGTDSGGFQVFSLPGTEISDRGVRFKNEVTGEQMEMTPESSIAIQNRLGADVIVHRNDQISVDEALGIEPTHLVISPGPGTPDDAGVSLSMIAAFERRDAEVREAARAFPGQVAVGLDARGGKVATRGWAEETDMEVTDLARAFEDAGMAAIIYTDIDRDGAMGGPNVAATEALARAVDVPVIASGGVSSMDDLLRLRDTGVIAGAISGRALYDGAIDLKAALGALG